MGTATADHDTAVHETLGSRKYFPWISTASFLVLVVLAPIAMVQVPYEPAVEMGVWTAMQSGQPTASPLQYALALAGVLAAVLTAAEFVVILPSAARQRFHGSIAAAFVIANVTIGYCAYPYWAFGVYAWVEDGTVTGALDPKALISGPGMTAVWEPWMIVVLLWLFPVRSALSIALILRIGVLCFRRRYRYVGAICFILAFPLTTYFFFMPGFWYWFMD